MFHFVLFAKKENLPTSLLLSELCTYWKPEKHLEFKLNFCHHKWNDNLITSIRIPASPVCVCLSSCFNMTTHGELWMPLSECFWPRPARSAMTCRWQNSKPVKVPTCPITLGHLTSTFGNWTTHLTATGRPPSDRHCFRQLEECCKFPMTHAALFSTHECWKIVVNFRHEAYSTHKLHGNGQP